MNLRFLVSFSLLFFSAFPSNAHCFPPKPSKKEVIYSFGEATWTDPYGWDDEEVLAYAQEENRYTEEATHQFVNLQEQLYNEMMQREKKRKMYSFPQKVGSSVYFQKTLEGKKYPSIYKQKEGQEELILDLSVLAEECENFTLGKWKINPQETFLALTYDTNGSGNFSLIFVDLIYTKEVFKKALQYLSGPITWSNNGQEIIYICKNEEGRSSRAGCYLLKDDLNRLIYEEKDEQFTLKLTKSQDDSCIFLTSYGQEVTEVRYLNANDLTQPCQLLLPKQSGIKYFANTLDPSSFCLLTNQEAPNFKVIKIPRSSALPEHWDTVIEHRKEISIEKMISLPNYLVLLVRKEGLPSIEYLDLKNGTLMTLDFTEPAYSLRLKNNHNRDAPFFYFIFSSPRIPPKIIQFTPSTAEHLIIHEEVIDGFDPSHYITERVFAKGVDGVSIPITLFYKRRHRPNLRIFHITPPPLLLKGYGAYGYSYDPFFSCSELSLVDRGVTVAIAHVRGGGELGPSWHEKGRLLSKKNTFEDFITCSEFLIKEKYTSPQGLAIWGRSAGGMLIGAVLNQRPDLFKAAIAEVPFVEVLNATLRKNDPWTVFEYKEWGDPHHLEVLDYVRSYSPYNNVKPQCYPSLLILGSFYDSLVPFKEPTKWTARLRDNKQDTNPLYLKVDMTGGHSPSKQLDKHLREEAFKYSFLLNEINTKTPFLSSTDEKP